MSRRLSRVGRDADEIFEVGDEFMRFDTPA
jgi:hypothetical protein